MKKYTLIFLFTTLILPVKAQTVSDADGNTYNTVTIGTQTWMKENLKTTKYNDGTAIPNVTTGSSWIALTSPAYCWYNNDASTYKATYGALYNWYTVNTGKLCPTGLHVASNYDWSELTTYLGGKDIVASKLQEVGFTHWCTYNTAATNSSGFTGLPGGYRKGDFGSDGSFINLGYSCFWWSSTKYDTTNAYIRGLGCGEIFVRDYASLKTYGYSIRCIKDTVAVEMLTVTFNVNGGSSVSSLQIPKDTKITKPSDPFKSGYTFAGWYKEAAYTTAWDFTADAVSVPITLYAKWTLINGVNHPSQTDFKLYPNPATNKFFVKSDNPSEGTIIIYDLHGQAVVNGKISQVYIDISNLSKGIYIVKMIDSGNTMVKKLVKE